MKWIEIIIYIEKWIPKFKIARLSKWVNAYSKWN